MKYIWKQRCRKNASAENKLNYLENCLDDYTNEFGQFNTQEFVADFIQLKDALMDNIPNLVEFLDEHPVYADNKVTSLLLGLITSPEPDSALFADFAECIETKNCFVPNLTQMPKQFSVQGSSPNLVHGVREELHVGDRIALYVSEVGGWLPVKVEKLLDDEAKTTWFKNETVGPLDIFKPESMLEYLPSERYNLPNTSEDNNTIQAIKNKEIWK